MITHFFEITGMSCDGCAARVKQAVLNVPGVHRADVDSEKGRLRAECDDIEPRAVIHALERIGFGAKVEE